MNKIKITLAFILVLVGIKVVANAEVLKPQDTAQFKLTSVRVYNEEMNSGGTGSILKSDEDGSQILTNKHVCRLVEQGGYVQRDGYAYPVIAYKKFSDHDLCIIKVNENFGINLTISKKIAKASDTIYVSGHPNLLPHILTIGHLSGDIEVRLIVGLRDCTRPSVDCLIFGGVPVIKSFDSQVVSNLIKPGSSGSAVFNNDGEIIGVVFAGSGRGFSHGFIVPQKYLLYFMAINKYTKFVLVGTPVDSHGLKGRIFNYKRCTKNNKSKKASSICNSVKSNMIYIGKGK